MTIENDDEPMNVSFSGCGFLGIYHVGVASAIREYSPQLFLTKVAGASAGAIAACGLICNMCLSQATSDVLKIVSLARQHQLGPLHPSINLMNILKVGLMKNLSDDAHKMATGRLFISMTRVSDGKNVLISDFDSKEELVQALLCSSFIPLYCGTLPPMFRGVRYMDGGFSDNLPILNGNTVTVSPFSGESDICPRDSDSQSFLSFDLTNMNIRFTSRNFYRFSVALFPPHPEIMSAMCREGFEDALRFLARHNLIACTRCIEVRSSIMLDENTTKEMAAALLQQKKSALKPQDIKVPSYEAANYLKNASKKVTFNDDSVNDSSSSTSPSSQGSVIWQGCKHHQVPARRIQSVKSLSKLIENDECETCKLITDAAAKKGLPEGVRQTLADAEAIERTWIRYILDVRPIKWIRYMTIPWLLPWDIAFSMFKRFLAWLPSWREDSMWIASQASDVVASYLLRDAEQPGSSRVTCEMAITDMTFSSDQTDQIVQPPLSLAVTNRLNVPSYSSRRSSVVDTQSVTSAMAGQGRQCTVTAMNFGFSVNMAASSDPVRQMADIVVRDNVQKRDLLSSAVTGVVEDLELEGFRQVTSLNPPDTQGTSSGQLSPPISADSLLMQEQQGNFDTYASILSFTHKRDALMAYYYMDENKQIKVTKIFGCDADNAPTPVCKSPLFKHQPNPQDLFAQMDDSKNNNAETPRPAIIVPEKGIVLLPPPGSKNEKHVAVVAPIVKDTRSKQQSAQFVQADPRHLVNRLGQPLVDIQGENLPATSPTGLSD